ncbi:MAG TPA: SMP-30/gluconolactonase/LRE family protein [Mycobacteriales bacterium]
MPATETLHLIREFLFPGRYERAAIPSLDGGLAANDALDAFDTVTSEPVTEPDDVLVGPDGAVRVTSGRRVLRVTGGAVETVATLPGDAGAMAWAADGSLLVCVAGHGLFRVEPDGGSPQLVADRGSDDRPLHCLTAVAVAADGSVYLTDGSTAHSGPDWIRDLMERNAAGRVLRWDGRDRTAQVLRGGLAYPHGVTLAGDGSGLLVTEAWRHRIVRLSLDGASVRDMTRTLPGYPARITPGPDGTYWVALFAMRTQLVEFVLTQREYVAEMMRTIDPDFWIRPALRTLNSGLAPLQGGQVIKLGVLKPWAPPRSYGLVARFDADGDPIESFHSRPGGGRHGITGVRQSGDTLFVAAKGGDQVLTTKAGAGR